ncbi:DUF262 domain-containing protein [Heliobacterium undosum]|uniref:DUF262 domain-containing protein n=2 Tax=Heliomicrobium undosum TaxID=121734 RepID=A0A845L588_9FIRM|nr:DUF262 domain-containing protein [Heliomicrobium undosum]
MSVGELLTMYKDGDLVLRPEFQRFFRWSPEQKSRLVESLLLGIPIPSIFVSQRHDGKWEVIDGLQRLSTLFELAGELRNPDGEKRPPLVLTKTKYLTDLKDLQWESEDKSKQFPEEAKRRIKRSRIDVNIVLSTSDLSAKYELFQRLNTGGSLATDQEVRNAILVMINREFFSWITDLAGRDYFRKCIPLTDRALEEQFDLELVTRFVVLSSLDMDALRDMDELGAFLTDKIVEMAEDASFDKDRITLAFQRTFDTLSRIFGEHSFKKFDETKQQATGAMLISIFEVLAIGIGTFAGDPAYVIPYEKIRELHRRLAKEIRFTSAAGSGIRASTRIPNTVGLGREFFAP